MERPVSIMWFERCYLGAVVVGLINSALRWPEMTAQMRDNPAVTQFGPSILYAILVPSLAIGILISLLLWYFAARKRAAVAKWVITVFFVLGVLSLGVSLLMRTFPTGATAILTIVGFVLNALSVWSLFRPGAEAWFAPVPRVDRATRL